MRAFRDSWKWGVVELQLRLGYLIIVRDTSFRLYTGWNIPICTIMKFFMSIHDITYDDTYRETPKYDPNGMKFSTQ